MIDDQYYFHQTPPAMAADLMQFVPYETNDILYEPFKGEGNFYNVFPLQTNKIWSEIKDGIDYKSIVEPYDVVITNPPFRLPNNKGIMKNAIFPLLEYFMVRARKAVCFLVSDYGFQSLTTKRINRFKELGFYLTKLVFCGAKKWRGRYVFMIFTKTPNNLVEALRETY